MCGKGVEISPVCLEGLELQWLAPSFTLTQLSVSGADCCGLSLEQGWVEGTYSFDVWFI